jgi:hypothetical protein
VRRHGKRGIVAGGALPGFARHRHALDAELRGAGRGRRTVRSDAQRAAAQRLRRGGVLRGYMEDRAADDWAALIVWRDPRFDG